MKPHCFGPYPDPVSYVVRVVSLAWSVSAEAEEGAAIASPAVAARAAVTWSVRAEVRCIGMGPL